MDRSDIARARLTSQQIAGHQFETVKDLVGWMGAMQAQDYAMAKWAIGLRIPNLKEQDVEAAIDRGEILRTHLLRPTWHFVLASDVYWLLELTAPQIKAKASWREKELGLNETIFSKANTLIESALKGGKSLTREELMFLLNQAGIPTDENRSSHLLIRAELDGIICSGATNGKKRTYALLEERVHRTPALSRKEALARLARTYFSSHGPATINDFGWWSGLPMGEAREGLEMAKENLKSETIEAQPYWLAENALAREGKERVVMLPGYDEYVISYKDRSAILSSAYQKKLISENGLFRPTILIDGQIKGTWKKSTKNDRVFLEIDLFEPLRKATLSLIEKACEPLGRFLDKTPAIMVNQGIL